MHTINMQKESSKLPKLLLVLLVATCSLFDFQASSNGLNGLLPDWVDGCTKCVPLSYT